MFFDSDYTMLICMECSHRFPVVGDSVPKHYCPKCGKSNWDFALFHHRAIKQTVKFQKQAQSQFNEDHRNFIGELKKVCNSRKVIFHKQKNFKDAEN